MIALQIYSNIVKVDIDDILLVGVYLKKKKKSHAVVFVIFASLIVVYVDQKLYYLLLIAVGLEEEICGRLPI